MEYDFLLKKTSLIIHSQKNMLTSLKKHRLFLCLILVFSSFRKKLRAYLIGIIVRPNAVFILLRQYCLDDSFFLFHALTSWISVCALSLINHQNQLKLNPWNFQSLSKLVHYRQFVHVFR